MLVCVERSGPGDLLGPGLMTEHEKLDDVFLDHHAYIPLSIHFMQQEGYIKSSLLALCVTMVAMHLES